MILRAMVVLPVIALAGTVMAASAPLASATVDDDGAFFENEIRPLLHENCVKCHGPKMQKSKLRLDTPAGITRGGERGALWVAGKPELSLIVEALAWTREDLQMPPRGRLDDAPRERIAEWIRRGAPMPSGEAAGEGDATRSAPPFDLDSRKQHWAWQPLARVEPPAVHDTDWPRDAVDRFVLAKLEATGLAPAPDAARATWLRRVSFDLIGLPPTISEQDAFLGDERSDARERVVDRLLASPHFGEKWARHWLDLARYADGRGHEFDFPIPNAWAYRDYLVRAFEADVPYDQLLREHVAGDQIEPPRLEPASGANESLLATGFWLLGEAVHSPVDIRGDECDRVANQIDTFSKAFLGVTLACARCHDHKFDALTQHDYYAMSSFLAGASARQAPYEAEPVNRRVAQEVADLRGRWQAELQRELATTLPARPPAPQLALPIEKVATIVDFAAPRPGDWNPDGVAFGVAPLGAGALRFRADPAAPIAGVAPIGMAARDAALDWVRPAADREVDPTRVRLLEPGRSARTRSFVLQHGRLHWLVRGKGILYACVASHRTLEGPLHTQTLIEIDTGGAWRIVTQEMHDYVGLRLHGEFGLAPFDEHGNAPDFAVAALWDAAQPPELKPVVDAPPDSVPDSAPDASLTQAASPDGALARFGAEQAALLAQMKDGSRVAPALLDGSAFDEPVLARGNWRTPREAAPRRFLEAIDGQEPLARDDVGSGRLALAARITDPTNPLVPRVAVNRIWQHLFGRGLVTSVDDFGTLGERPSHPELLDTLASEFMADGWSQKRLIRRLVLSRTYAMSSGGGGSDDAEQDAAELDPTNALLHQMSVRRLTAEQLRDALLFASGSLDPKRFGPTVPTHLTPFMDGRGRPSDGPLDGAGRRTLYLAVKRNYLDPFLLAFDFPNPAATCGRRTVSNVPAQSLALMNGELVQELARRAAQRSLAGPPTTPAARVESLLRTVFARPPTESERHASLAWLNAQVTVRAVPYTDPALWSDWLHVLFCAKSFLFLD